MYALRTYFLTTRTKHKHLPAAIVSVLREFDKFEYLRLFLLSAEI